MKPMQGVRTGLLAVGVLAAFTPVSFQRGGVPAGATAACPTCCPQPGPTCVICGTGECVVISGYYEGKIGPGACGNQT